MLAVNKTLLLQRGTAIFSALFIVATATVIATSLIVQQRIDIKRTQQMLSAEQAYRHAQGALYWAKGIARSIQLSADNDDEDANQKQLQWPIHLPTTILQDRRGTVTAELDNLENYFNVNSIKSEEGFGKFIELLQKINSNFSEEQRLQIAEQIRSWISAPEDINDDDDDEENENLQDTDAILISDDEQYFKFTPPYRPSHRAMISISELRQIASITPAIYQTLTPHLIALPFKNESNLNKNTSKNASNNTINNSSNNTSNNSSNNATNSSEGKDINPNEGFYLLTTQVTLDDQRLRIYTLLQEAQENNQPTARILWQSFGTR